MVGKKSETPALRCAIYTRKSTEEGLAQEFNSLDAQREACESYIASQRGEGWVCLSDRYDDGGYPPDDSRAPSARTRPSLPHGLRSTVNGLRMTEGEATPRPYTPAALSAGP